ncbi:AraC family transcriptional regulator [Actinomycetota bacterium]
MSGVAEFARSSALPHVETRRSCQENSCYRPHTHDTLSLGGVDAGASTLAGPLAGRARLLPGDVVVIPAGHVHACNPHGGMWLYEMTHVDQDWAAGLLPGGIADPLLSGVAVLRHPDLRGRLRAVGDAVLRDAPADELTRLVAGLLEALRATPPRHHVEAEWDPGLGARLEPVLRRLGEDERNPALEDLADMVGMSTHQLVRAVKRLTGLSPLAWRQNTRVLRGRRLLSEGHSVAETAHLLGFADQSHFHRVFRAHVAATPGAYQGRKNVQDEVSTSL